MNLRARIERLADAFHAAAPAEIVVRGGLPDANPFDQAKAGGREWRRQPDETEDAFRARARLEAEAAGAEHIVFGGLQNYVR